ncbi:15281_t:CDS:1, partial [Funneliformis geosporum]
ADKYPIRVNTRNNVNFLKGEIKWIFVCNKARDIELWRTEMPNDSEDTFTNLVLDENNNLKKLTEGEFK